MVPSSLDCFVSDLEALLILLASFSCCVLECCVDSSLIESIRILSSASFGIFFK